MATVFHEDVHKQHLGAGFRNTTTRIAAAVAAAIFLLLAGFQVALALGAPWGAAAWGGNHDVLPSGLRLASIAAAAVLVVPALVILGRAGYWKAGFVPFRVFEWGTLVMGALMALSALGNFASSSAWERFLNGPVALVLALLCFVVAVGARRTLP